METPELDKIRAVKEKSQAIGEFIDWLTYEKKIHLSKWVKFDEFEEKQLTTINTSITTLLEEFFNIDGKKAEEERLNILEEIRKNG